jgi:hypothetical protein
VRAAAAVVSRRHGFAAREAHRRTTGCAHAPAPC